MEMSVVVKKRLIDLLQDDHKNYYELVSFFLDGDISNFEKEKKSVHLLRHELDTVNLNKISVPENIEEIKEWYQSENRKACQLYQTYLTQRKSGCERTYFKNIGQAFEFLVKVAPTKKVDGSWLYSIVNYWNDPIFHDLILIYLEELGLGQAKSNHVCMYDDLLRCLGLDDFEFLLEDEYYHHAAVQLALGYAPPEFIPEIIGYNLGYEQLPLHLLITNYELKELGIDAKYFNLHITIDNLANGHAHKSLKVLENVYKKYKDKQLFMQKVKQGYALNQHGISSTQIIKSLDLEKFVHKILKRKAMIGQLVHNEKQLIGCKSINQWLANPHEIGSFIQQLVEKKWIRFNLDPEQSMFWRMIGHEDGKMYGVFTPAERQIIYDWIAGEQYATHFLPYHQGLNTEQPFHDFLFSYISDGELESLQKRVSQTDNFALKLCKLTPFLAPESHHKSIGLWSTQKYVELLFPYLSVSAR
jgi:hypothetical protein